MVRCPDCGDELHLNRVHGQHQLACRACGWARWMGPRGEPRKRPAIPAAAISARNRRIVERVDRGETQVSIARDLGVTKQRINQIVARVRAHDAQAKPPHPGGAA